MHGVRVVFARDRFVESCSSAEQAEATLKLPQCQHQSSLQVMRRKEEANFKGIARHSGD